METKRVKILAIDDTYDNLVVLKALLDEAFPLAEFISAQSGRAGIVLCIDHRPDLILLDIVMPGMDGYEVCRTLKSDDLFKNIPIVMVTAAHTDRVGRIKAIEAGADGFLTKPLDESELIAQVRAMLRIKEAEDRKLDEKERLETLVKERTEALLSELSERKKAERKLQEIYDFNESLLHTIPFGMNIVDDKGTILFQNEIFKEYFGRKALGKKCRELHSDSSFDFKDCPLKKSLEIGETHLCEAIDVLGGKTFDVSHIGMIYQGEKAMLEIFQDVTERKRVELIQKVLSSISSAVISTKDLDEFSTFILKQLSQLIDTTNFRIVFYDEDTDICTSPHYADQREDITSWPAEKSVTGYLIKENKSLLLTKADIEDMITAGKVDSIGIPCEIWLGVPLREEGKVIGAFVLQNYDDPTAYNIKDLELLEFISNQISIFIQRKKGLQDLMVALEKAEESDKLKTAFLSNMSHEIRSPMNGILGFSELLDDDNLTSEERRKFLDIINTNGQHLLSIINDILDIARIDSNQLVVNNTDFNLNQMLDDIWVSYENSKISMGKEHIKFQLVKDLKDDKCTINCDDVRLRQILYNLLGNSLKFTKKGHIKFGYKHQDDKLQFYVQDTGKGISLENQTLVFERFRQEEETYTRQFGGTGLGLSISKKLAELLGGEMWLESEQGVGTTFYFTIPYPICTCKN